MNALSAIAGDDDLQDWSRETQPRADGSKSLLIVDSNDCRWLVGRMHFCGQRVRPGKPYCEKHCGEAYVRAD